MLVGCTLGLSGAAAPEPLKVFINTQDGAYILGPHMAYLEDPSTSLTIREISSPDYQNRFIPHTRDFPSFGFTDSAYWLRTPLINQTDEPQHLILEQTSSWIDSIKIFILDTEQPGQWKMRHLGDKLPFNAREVNHPGFLLPMTLQPG